MRPTHLLCVLLLASGYALKSADLPDIVARVGGIPVMGTSINNAIGDRLIRMRTEEYNLTRSVLEARIDSLLLQLEAERRGLTIDALVQTEIDNKVQKLEPEHMRGVLAALTLATAFRQGELQENWDMEGRLYRSRATKRRAEFISALRLQFRVDVSS